MTLNIVQICCVLFFFLFCFCFSICLHSQCIISWMTANFFISLLPLQTFFLVYLLSTRDSQRPKFLNISDVMSEICLSHHSLKPSAPQQLASLSEKKLLFCRTRNLSNCWTVILKIVQPLTPPCQHPYILGMMVPTPVPQSSWDSFISTKFDNSLVPPQSLW